MKEYISHNVYDCCLFVQVKLLLHLELHKIIAFRHLQDFVLQPVLHEH